MTFPAVIPPAVAVLLADAAAPADQPDFMRNLVSTLPIALIVLAAWLLLFRPEREKQRRQQELLATLKKNDRVITSAGIVGTVANVDRPNDRLTLRIDDSARITVTLSSVARVLGDKPAAESAAD
ncbi:MAG: preprotein translocase subunit YajC [Planctomycetaceae bacterium]